MRTLSIPEGRLLIVPGLPEDAQCFVGGGDTPFCTNPDGEYLNCRFGGSGLNIALPPGSWSLLGKASELTEEQMRQIAGEAFKDHGAIIWHEYSRFLTFHDIKPEDVLLIENKK